MSKAPLEKFEPAACSLFAACLAALGVIHVIAGEAVTRLFQGWPAWLPGRPYWAHVGGALLAILGGMALFRIRARPALTVMGILILGSVFVLHLPRAIAAGDFGDAWGNFFKWLAMAAGTFLFAGTCAATGGARILGRLTEMLAAGAPGFLAAFMIGAAILHVRAAAAIDQYYMPAYIPWHLFWIYFTAGALALGGVGLLVPPTRRLAARLTSLMIFLWCPLLHIPRTFAEPRNPAEWCGVFESLAFAAIAFQLAVRAPRKKSD